MDKGFRLPISEEKFAAFLDDNLSPDEMQNITDMVNADGMLLSFLGMSDQIDDDLMEVSPDIFSVQDDPLLEEIDSDDWMVGHDDWMVGCDDWLNPESDDGMNHVAVAYGPDFFEENDALGDRSDVFEHPIIEEASYYDDSNQMDSMDIQDDMDSFDLDDGFSDMHDFL